MPITGFAQIDNCITGRTLATVTDDTMCPVIASFSKGFLHAKAMCICKLLAAATSCCNEVQCNIPLFDIGKLLFA